LADAAAAPAAAPAASSPAKAPPPTPSGKSPQAFDVRLAIAKSLGTPGSPNPAPVTAAEGNIDAEPAAEKTDGTDAAEPAGETPAEGAEAAAAEDADGDAAATDGAAEPAETLEAVAKAFDAGDIEAMAAALKKAGMKVSGPVARAFRAHQRREQKAAERDRKAEQRDREFNEARARAQQSLADDSRRVAAAERNLSQKFGWALQLTEAWDNDDALALGKALERACKGASLATITQRLASGKTGKTPDEQRLADERKRFEEEKAAEANKRTQAEDSKQRAQQREAAMTRVGESLKAHPYLQTTGADGKTALDPEALSEVFSAYEASWNGEKFTKTAKACADELQEKLLARAKARGLAVVPAGKTPPAATGKAGKKPPPRTLREPPRTQSSPRGTPQNLEETRPNRIAQARRVTEMQRRGVR